MARNTRSQQSHEDLVSAAELEQELNPVPVNEASDPAPKTSPNWGQIEAQAKDTAFAKYDLELVARLSKATKEQPFTIPVGDDFFSGEIRISEAEAGNGLNVAVVSLASKIGAFETSRYPRWIDDFADRLATAQVMGVVRRNAYRPLTSAEQLHALGRRMTAAELTLFHVYPNTDFNTARVGDRLGVMVVSKTVRSSILPLREWQYFGLSPLGIGPIGKHDGNQNRAQQVHNLYWELVNGGSFTTFFSYSNPRLFNYLMAVITNSVLPEDDDAVQEHYAEVVVPTAREKQQDRRAFRKIMRKGVDLEPIEVTVDNRDEPVVVDGTTRMVFSVHYGYNTRTITINPGQDWSNQRTDLLAVIENGRKITLDS